MEKKMTDTREQRGGASDSSSSQDQARLDRAAAILREETHPRAWMPDLQAPALRAMLRFADAEKNALRDDLARVALAFEIETDRANKLDDEHREACARIVELESAVQSARAEEREACAKLCDAASKLWELAGGQFASGHHEASLYCADRIRERAPAQPSAQASRVSPVTAGSTPAPGATPPAPTDAEVLERWIPDAHAAVDRYAPRGRRMDLHRELDAIASHLRSAPAEEPKAKACVHELTDCPQCSPAPPAASEADEYERVAMDFLRRSTVIDGARYLAPILRENFKPLVEALERMMCRCGAADNPSIPHSPLCPKGQARSALSSLRARMEQGA